MVFARGDIAVANVTAEGTASVTLSGVSEAVGAELEGISRLYVDAASGEARCVYIRGGEGERGAVLGMVLQGYSS